MVLAGLLSGHQLLQSRERAERIHNDLADVGVAAQIKLTLGDVTRVVGHGVCDVAARKGGHGDDGDGTAARTFGELHSLFVDFGQIGVERTGHGVFRRNLVHTVAHDGERVSIRGHVGQEHEHRLMLLNSEILCRRQRHIGHEEALNSGVFRRVDEGDDAVQRTGAGEGVAEEVVVVVGHTHAAQDDLVSLGTHGHQCHHFIERLVGVREEGDLLSGHQRVVEVDAGNAGSNQFGGLLAAHGIHRGAADGHFLALDFRSAVDGLSIGVEETSGQLVADLQRGRLAEEGHFSVGRNAAGAFKHLQRDLITLDFHHLSQTAVDGGQLVVAYALGFERTGGLRDLADLCIYFLECLCHSLMH